MSFSIVGAMSCNAPPVADGRRAADIQEGNQVQRVRGVRLSGRRVVHHLGVAVVGGDQDFAAGSAGSGDHPSDADVECFDRPARGIQVAGVPDHVAVRVIAHDGVVLSARRSLRPACR